MTYKLRDLYNIQRSSSHINKINSSPVSRLVLKYLQSKHTYLKPFSRGMKCLFTKNWYKMTAMMKSRKEWA